jgi:hypothetical protein
MLDQLVRATTASDARRCTYAAHLAAFAEWSWDRGWRPDTGPLLDMDRIERYVAVGMDNAKDSARATRRSILRRMALKLSPELRDVPDREPITYRRVPPPYSPDLVQRYVQSIAAQPTPKLRRCLASILYLGLGCGLDTRDLGWVRGTDVARNERGVQATVVGGARPRTVMALAIYEGRIEALADGDAERLLIGGRFKPYRKNVTSDPISRMIVDETLPKLVVGRLRSTWLLGHLNRRTPLPLLMEQAGLKTVRPLEDLLEFADPFDEAHRSQWMRAEIRLP